MRKLITLLTISALLSLSSCKRSSKDPEPEPDKNLLVLVGAIDSQKGVLYAFDANTGAVKWTYETEQAIVSSPIISDSLAFSVATNYMQLISTPVKRSGILTQIDLSIPAL